YTSITEAARRICYGKSLNAGQTCVAPDYVLVGKEQAAEFVTAYKFAFKSMYPTLANNDDYTAIINTQQYRRLLDLIDDAQQQGANISECNPAQEDLYTGRKLA
ncbi:aldehyde dehydrogenase family protein, partial [Marinomonas agarivorans]